MTKQYSNGEITVVWKPDLCRHTGICARGLPMVFDPRRRPWVVLDSADSATIAAQVARGKVGAVVEPPHGGRDALPDVRGDPRLVVDDSGHRLQAHAGECRHVTHGGSRTLT